MFFPSVVVTTSDVRGAGTSASVTVSFEGELGTTGALPLVGGRSALTRYSDAKVANREIRVWHGATEKGP